MFIEQKVPPAMSEPTIPAYAEADDGKARRTRALGGATFLIARATLNEEALNSS
jgi:hypothetical protein